MHRSHFSLALLAALTLLLSGCGGTKVYETTRTIVYQGNIYQVTDVKSIRRINEAQTGDQGTVDLTGMSREAITSLIESHQPLPVRMAFMLDDQELPYSNGPVSSWRDYDRRKSDFDRAGKRIAKLMTEKKTEQLNLR
ncbi:MAG: hypothetical protein HRU51_01595 [Xanthomonadales bacterium]|nr:hypothetical protein [Xanthomonadales bacterium]